MQSDIETVFHPAQIFKSACRLETYGSHIIFTVCATVVTRVNYILLLLSGEPFHCDKTLSKLLKRK